MHPIFDTPGLKWSDPNVTSLRTQLERNARYKSPPMIDLLYQSAGGDSLDQLNLNKAPGEIWKTALENLHGGGCLRAFCELLKGQATEANLKKVLTAILEAESITELRVIDRYSLLDRKNLRIKLTDLSKQDTNTRVIIVRGDKKTGKSYGRLLFLEVAKACGGTPIMMKKGQITVLKDVLNSMFGPIGGFPDSIRKRLEDFEKKNDLDTTDFAWLNEICTSFLSTAKERNASLWIAMDNLGRDNDALLLPEEIRLFFDRLVLQMSSMSYHGNVRLMLMDYPPGDTPSNWEETIWQEDKITQDDVKETDIVDAIESWCRKYNLTVHKDDILGKAAEILVLTDRSVTQAQPGQPVYRIEMIDKLLKEYLYSL